MIFIQICSVVLGIHHLGSRLFISYFVRPEIPPFTIIIQMSYQFVMQLIIHMCHASLIPCISLDQYLNPNLYIIPNMQNMRFFCCSVYVQAHEILVHIALMSSEDSAKLVRIRSLRFSLTQSIDVEKGSDQKLDF